MNEKASHTYGATVEPAALSIASLEQGVTVLRQGISNPTAAPLAKGRSKRGKARRLNPEAASLVGRVIRSSNHLLKVRLGPAGGNHELGLGRDWRRRLSELDPSGLLYSAAAFADVKGEPGEAIASSHHWLRLVIGGRTGYSDEFAALEDLTRCVEWIGIPLPTHVALTRSSLTAFWSLNKSIATEQWTEFSRELDRQVEVWGMLVDHSYTARIDAMFALPGLDTDDDAVEDATYVVERVSEIPWDDLYRQIAWGRKELPNQEDRERFWTSSSSWCRVLCTFRPKLSHHATSRSANFQQICATSYSSTYGWFHLWLVCDPAIDVLARICQITGWEPGEADKLEN